MGMISIWYWIVDLAVLGFIGLGIWGQVRVLHKAGYSGWWCLIYFVPIVNVVMTYVFAFTTWPRDRAKPVT